MAGRVLAGVLALLLLAAATVSVNHTLHRALHSGATAHSHFCLVCSLSKGQLDVADVALVSAVFVCCILLGVCLANSSFLPGFDYRLAPSRAPPRR